MIKYIVYIYRSKNTLEFLVICDLLSSYDLPCSIIYTVHTSIAIKHTGWLFFAVL